jgi:GGDEF domain-containing protein
MGGDEFLCAFSDTRVEQVRQRFDEIGAELARARKPAFITVGFSELGPRDARDEVVARADADLLAKRGAARAPRNGGVRVAWTRVGRLLARSAIERSQPPRVLRSVDPPSAPRDDVRSTGPF